MNLWLRLQSGSRGNSSRSHSSDPHCRRRRRAGPRRIGPPRRRSPARRSRRSSSGHLLELVGEHVPTPIDVVLERDGCSRVPSSCSRKSTRARVALARGRARAASGGDIARALGKLKPARRRPRGCRNTPAPTRPGWSGFSPACIQTRRCGRSSISNPRLVTSLWGLSREQAQSVAGIDREGLQLAAASFCVARKSHVDLISIWSRFSI